MNADPLKSGSATLFNSKKNHGSGLNLFHIFSNEIAIFARIFSVFLFLNFSLPDPDMHIECYVSAQTWNNLKSKNKPIF